MPAQRDPYTSPAVRAFANELTAYREQAGHTKAELATLTGYSANLFSQLEGCKNIPSLKVAEDMDTFFKTNGVFVRLRENIIESRQAVTLPPGFTEYVDREVQALTVRVFSPLLVPGLFQAEEYMEAIVGYGEVADANDHVERRRRRQALLTGEDPPQVWLTLDEAVLRRMVGSPEIQRAQLRYLLEASDRPRVMVNVVPQDRGYYPGLAGSFIILGFEDGSQISYMETAGTGILIEDPARVAEYLGRYDLIRGHALDVHESRAMIRTILEKT